MRSRRFHVCDTFPRVFNDGMRNRPLWDPAGFRDKATGMGLPDGELVRQFMEVDSSKVLDIADAIADVEHVYRQSGDWAVYYSPASAPTIIHPRYTPVWRNTRRAVDGGGEMRSDWMDRLGPAPS